MIGNNGGTKDKIATIGFIYPYQESPHTKGTHYQG